MLCKQILVTSFRWQKKTEIVTNLQITRIFLCFRITFYGGNRFIYRKHFANLIREFVFLRLTYYLDRYLKHNLKLCLPNYTMINAWNLYINSCSKHCKITYNFLIIITNYCKFQLVPKLFWIRLNWAEVVRIRILKIRLVRKLDKKKY